MATATATTTAGAASSRLSFRRAVSSPSPTSSSQLRLPEAPPPRRASFAVVALHKRNPKRLKYASQRQFTRGDAGMLRVQVEPSGEDLWKLEPVVDLINRGAVGIIPTDTVYSIVCDLSNNDSVERLRRIKGIGDSKARYAKTLSASCAARYETLIPTQPDFLEALTKGKLTYFVLSSYTFILPATKELPKQCIRHGSSTRYAKRRQVGVRLPDDPICEAILQNLDEPLICTSVKSLSEDEWILDPVIIADIYEQQGLDFVVDGGTRIADPSTVVDMTGSYPTIIRQGKGPKLDWMVAEDEEQESRPTFAFKAA
uniref:Threonylcarbamoyl-AMP synthase n=1 Tax=Oryza punctata TaxID=4537 RepID=A0A0E0LX91_ORYPU